jgi:hypothetical protein
MSAHGTRLRLPVSHRQVVVGPEDGYSDVVALEASPDLAGAVAVCKSRTLSPDGARLDAAALPVSDVDYLVVALRTASLGGAFVGEATCRACSAAVDISFPARSYLEHRRPRKSPACEPAVHSSEGHTTVPGTPVPGTTVPDATVPDAPLWWRLKRYPLSFRAPTAADVLECQGNANARQLLLERCLAGQISPAGARAAERAMATVAPTLQSEVTGQCPECGAPVSLSFDALSFCLTELSHRASSVLADVVTLASSFRWDEADILALPSARRRTYVELLTSSLAAPSLEAWVA